MLFRKGAIAVLLPLLASLWAQEKKKEWKDRAEYELYESTSKTQDPALWLTPLDKWKSQYPQSDFADVRRKLYLEAYRTTNKPREAFNIAIEVLQDNPNDLVALSAIVGYVYPLVPFGTMQPSPQQTDDLDTAEKAAVRILSNLDTIYSKDNRPTTMTEEQANQAKPALRAFAQKTLGYIALERKDYQKAQTELTTALALDPNQAQVSFWLGSAILAQNKARPELQAVALYDFARGAAYDGPGSLPLTDRKQVQEYLNNVYVQYHGSAEGLDKLLANAKTAALPASGFVIKSKGEVEKEKLDAEEAAARANPMLALWKSIRKELISDAGVAYFENNMKGALLPGGVNNVTKFRGKLVSISPATRPRELVLAMEGDAPDATLKLDSSLPGKMEAGAEIEFDGVAVSFAKDPFMVTFNVEKAHLEGWTGKNLPSQTKKGAGGKKSGAN